MELRLLIRRLGRSLTISQKLDVAKRRERLRARVDSFNRTAMNFLGRNTLQTILENVSLLSEEFDMDDVLQIDDPLPTENFEPGTAQVFFAEGAPAAGMNPHDVALAKAGRAAAAARSATEAIEHINIALPSTLGLAELKARQLESLLWKEYELRKGQANEALQGVRVSIANLSFEYGKKLRKIKKSKVKKTRAWAGVQSVGRVLHHHRLIYAHAVAALQKLGDPENIVGILYKPLEVKDMKANTAIADPNAAGQRNLRPAWFWAAELSGDTDDNSRLAECEWLQPSSIISKFDLVHRVNWLRARGRYHRWREEFNITSHEMEWVTRFFMHQMKKWTMWKDSAITGGKNGHVCYAEAHIDIWKRLAEDANKRFADANSQYKQLILL